jgi:hypothetical protein
MVAIALLIYTIIEAPNDGWLAGRSLGGFFGSAALFAVFVAWEGMAAEPMLDVRLFRNLRFSAASGSVTIAFFALSGFIFLVTQYFQFLKGYAPLATGVRLLPVAVSVAVASVVGTQLAVVCGTKLVVAGGLGSLAGAFAWVSTASTGTSYSAIAGQMVLIGVGIGLTSAPATESIMGVVPTAKAGVGSAINDATRVLGSTLGVAVIGSVYASLYASKLAALLPAAFPTRLAAQAHQSVGAALEIAQHVARGGRGDLAARLHLAASQSFFHGFGAAVLVAAGVAGAGALLAGLLIPAHPTAAAGPRAAAEAGLGYEAQ